MKNFYNLLKRSSKKLLFMMILLAAAGYASAQLTITKEATPEAHPDQMITYRIEYKNTGTTIQHNVVIRDPLPAFDGVYMGSSPEGDFNPSTGEITWTKDQIPALENFNAGTGVIYVYGKAGVLGSQLNTELGQEKYYPDGLYLHTSPYTIYNTAYIKSDEVTTEVPSNEVNTIMSQTCTGTLSNATGIIKSASNSELKYVISVANTGNVWNRWQLSAEYIPTATSSYLIPSFEDLDGNPLNNNMTEWVKPGLSTLVVMKLVSNTGTNPSIDNPHDPNITRVTATPVACGEPFYNDYTTDICGGNCPEYLFATAYKIDTPDPVQSGATLTYQVILYNSFTDNQNNGLPVSDITLTESYPSLVSYISSTEPHHNGSAVPYTLTGNNVWTFSSLPYGLTTFNITVKVADNTPNNTNITNTLALTNPDAGTEPFDIWYENTLINSAQDLWVDKTANVTYAEQGDIVTYKIRYGNKGNFQGDNVKIIDNYNDEYMTVVDPNGATDASGNLTWEFSGPMAIGYVDSISYTLQVKNTTFPEGTTRIPNTVNILNYRVPHIAYDANFPDNQDTYDVYVANLPDLSISKTANPSPVSAAASPGAQVTYTITVGNIGDLNHTGYYDVTDVLPAGVTYVSSNPAGTYDSGNHSVTWSDNTSIQIGATKTFTLTVGGITYDMGGDTLSNKATVASRLSTEKTLTNNETTVLTPLIYPNYWLGNISTDWAVAGNWTYGIPGTNGIDDDVIFATVPNYTSAAQRDLKLDMDRQIGKLINASDKALIIPTGKTLKINEKATNNAPERLRLESEPGQANGALIFNYPALNPAVLASVEFASKSKPGTGTWPRVWQYFGTPVKNKTLSNLFGPNVQGSIYGGDPTVNTIVRKYDETWVDPSSYQEKWRDIGLTDNMIKYAGYEITQPQAVFENAGTSPYVFKGELVADEDFSLSLNISPVGTYARGNYILANPYAAPIFISNMLPADFENLAQTIYLYNTGSRQDWLTNNGASQLGTQPGTYTSVPILPANTIGITQIPSMQGFMVKASEDVTPTSFKFRYATVNRGALTYANEAMHIKRAEAPVANDIKPLLTMDVIGESGSDRVYLITAPGTTKSYDAGWDGYKTLSTDNVQLFALDADNRRMQVNTDNNLNDTYIGFRTGGESTYTLKFTFNNEMQGVYESLFVQDLATGAIHEVTNGAEFTFESTAPGSVEKRFKFSASKITTDAKTTNLEEALSVKANSKTIAVTNSSNQDVVVTIYDLVGKSIMNRSIAAGNHEFDHGLSRGTYVIEAKAIESGSRVVIKTIISE